jgi:hypothetical protein
MFIRNVALMLGVSGLISMVLFGSGLPAAASGTPAADAPSSYELINAYGYPAYVPVDTENIFSLSAVYPEKWEWDGGDRDVAGQEENVGGDWCLTPVSGSEGAGLTSTSCNGSPKQEWWLDPSNDLLINEYWSSYENANVFLCTNTQGVEYMRNTTFYNGYCQWTIEAN